MKPPLNLVILKGVPVFRQLQLEEALLRADKQNWCLLNDESPPAIVMGVSGKIESTVNIAGLTDRPIPVIRRFTGGGTVVVDENTLFVTFVCNSSSVKIPPFPKHLMEWSAEFYRPLFPENFFQLRENDYVSGNRKWGGNAQSIAKDRWLHHSSLLWDYRSELMNVLLLPPKMPMYRQTRSHEDFLCKLSDHHPDKDTFFRAFVEEVKKLFCVKRIEPEEVEKIALLPHRKATRLIK